MTEDHKASELSQLDLALCVDLTNSMTPFIDAARERFVAILDELVDAEGLDLRVGIVGYRDYGPLAKGELVEVHAMSREMDDVRRTLEALFVASPSNNTDAAEAVFAGLLAAVDELSWRARATKIIVLVGDAPPHGCDTRFGRFPDRYEEDPTGKTLLEVGAHIEAADITLYALGMVPSVTAPYDETVQRTFTRLSRTTGGAYHNARDGAAAMTVVGEISTRVSRQIGFDRHVYFAVADLRQRASEGGESLRALVDASIEMLEQKLEAPADEIYAALSRLQKRGL
ncbi:MAG: VWA domain-containing protein [Myxococcales bacterium]|nr:VWA domain-containing protein [Myxococcales bacterium]